MEKKSHERDRERGSFDGSRIVQIAEDALREHKGEAISILDIRDLSDVADYFVVVSGSSPPHLKAMANEVEHALKGAGMACYRRAGDPHSGWIVLDYVDVIIHIFEHSLREYYAIEGLWGKVRRSKPPANP